MTTSFPSGWESHALIPTANVKQALTILIAVFLFHLSISPLNALGILLTLIGGALYAHVDYFERNN